MVIDRINFFLIVVLYLATAGPLSMVDSLVGLFKSKVLEKSVLRLVDEIRHFSSENEMAGFVA